MWERRYGLRRGGLVGLGQGFRGSRGSGEGLVGLGCLGVWGASLALWAGAGRAVRVCQRPALEVAVEKRARLLPTQRACGALGKPPSGRGTRGQGRPGCV